MLSHDDCNSKISKNSGVTLIELMISIAIGTLMVGIVLHLLMSAKQVTERQSDVLDVMNKSINLAAIFKAQIKRAGFIGCARISSGFNLMPVGKYSINEKNRVIGTDHELVIRYEDFKTDSLQYDMVNKVTLIVASNVNIHPNEIWVISNCQRAEWFEVEAIKRDHGLLLVRLKQPLSELYDHKSELGKLKINRLYLQTSKNHSTLIMQDIDGRNSKIMEDIHNLNFQFTINEANRLIDKKSDEINDWSLVRGVAITAMIKSGKVINSWREYYAIQ